MITEQGSWYSVPCGDTNTDYLALITVSSVYISYQDPLVSHQLSISQQGFKITLIMSVLQTLE